MSKMRCEMYKIATLNKISPVGLGELGENYSVIDDPKEANGIIVRSHDMHEMEFGDDLLAIARAGAGVNNIPIDRCAEEGIVVFNAPGANANAVKELIICALVMSARNVPSAISWVGTLESDVKKTVEKGKSQFAGNEIQGKVLGVIGLGAIGVMVANAALKLGMKVIGYDPFISLHSAHELSNKIPVGFDLGTILPQCDYITIHVPANEETKGMFDSRRFGQIKDGAVLLNFARDTLVNMTALKEALKTGALKQYMTDFPTDELLGTEGVMFLPHLGASTTEAEDNCASMAALQLMDYIENGNIVNSVNFPACSMGPLNDKATARVCILNKNVPSVLGQITGIMSDMNVNIRDMTNKSRGEYAYTILDIDADMSEERIKEAVDIEGVIRVRVLK